MEKSTNNKWFVAIGTLVLVGCGSSTSPENEGGAQPATVTADFEVLEFRGTTPFPALAGAEVCVYGADNCATTDAQGRVTLEMPANAETAVTIEMEGFVPAISPFTTGDADFSAQTLSTASDLLETLAIVLGTPWPMNGTGAVSLGTIGADPFVFGEDGIPGVTISVSESVGRRFYFDGAIPSTEIESTTNTLGTGGFVEMPAGDYEVNLGGTASNCRAYGAWEGDGENVFAFPVVVGYITYAFVMCDPAS